MWMSVGVGGKDVGGVTLPILKVEGHLKSTGSSEPLQRYPVPHSFRLYR